MPRSRLHPCSRLRREVGAFLGALGIACCVVVSGALAGVVPGDVAPDFTLQDPDGVSHALHDHAGKVVLLVFSGYG